MEQVCRVCMSNSVTLVDIFAERHQMQDEPSLAAMLNECVNCEINPDDLLPKQICLSCVLATQSAFKLKRTCEQSHRQFCLLLGKTETSRCGTIKTDDWQLETFESIYLGCTKQEQLESQMLDSWEESLQDNLSECKEANSGSSNISVECPPVCHRFDAKPCATDDPHLCYICGQLFSDNALLSEHVAYHTTEDYRFKCSHCPKAFQQRSKLQDHIRIHTGERPFKCPQCSKCFRLSQLLKAHMFKHTGERPFKCPECPKEFALKYHLNAHMRGHTGERPHTCPHCPKAFNKSSNLQSHLRVHSGERPFVCDHCSKTFNHASNLEKHIRIHTGNRPHQCPHCPKAFTRKRDVNDHLVVHTNERPFKCEKCLRDFKSSAGRRMHVCKSLDHIRASKRLKVKPKANVPKPKIRKGLKGIQVKQKKVK